MPKELQGVFVIKKTGGTRRNSKRRSLSASSKDSGRSFKRRKTSYDEGPSPHEISKYHANGGKFLKPTLKGKKLPKLKNTY